MVPVLKPTHTNIPYTSAARAAYSGTAPTRLVRTRERESLRLPGTLKLGIERRGFQDVVARSHPTAHCRVCRAWCCPPLDRAARTTDRRADDHVRRSAGPAHLH